MEVWGRTVGYGLLLLHSMDCDISYSYFYIPIFSFSLRDLLHNKYRSSTKAKKIRRKEITVKMSDDVDELIMTNTNVARRIEQLSVDIKRGGKLSHNRHVVASRSCARRSFRAHLCLIVCLLVGWYTLHLLHSHTLSLIILQIQSLGSIHW
jgi:hypothetical protein